VSVASADSSSAILSSVYGVLTDAGLARYEISNFARPGFESLHNLTYWRLRPWLAAGPGATALVPDEKGTPMHVVGPRDFGRYVSDDDFSVRHEPLSPTDLAEEVVMGGLRTREGLDRFRFLRVFGIDPLELFARTMERWTGFFHRTGPDRIALTEGGLMVMNPILVDAFQDIDREYRRLAASPYRPAELASLDMDTT
jgi:oxygen-independent coproporphyrinogen-3 oxidase